METTIIRYIGRKEGMQIKKFQDILRSIREKTFESQSCLDEKKVEITISIKEI